MRNSNACLARGSSTIMRIESNSGARRGRPGLGASPGVPHLHFLDALRGLAAFFVIVYHMVLMPEPDLAVPRWGHLVAHNGGMGVTLFFVVSAFSLFYTMPLRLREPRPWVSFFVHRFFRIAPLFYLWIVLSLIRDKALFGVDHGLREVVASAT